MELNKSQLYWAILSVWTMLAFASDLKAQQTDSILGFLFPESGKVFVIGETHTCELLHYEGNTKSNRDLVSSYTNHIINVSEFLIRNRNVKAVYLEMPIYSSYFLSKYQETKDPSWLDCIGGDDFCRQEFIKYIDFISIYDSVEFRCFDMPHRTNLYATKLVLLALLFESSGIRVQSYTDIDSLLLVTDIDSLLMDSNKYIPFKDEIETLINSLYSNNRKANLKLHGLLFSLKTANKRKYMEGLSSSYTYYLQVLASIPQAYNWSRKMSYQITNYRDSVLFNNYCTQRIDNENSIVIIGNSHISNLKSSSTSGVENFFFRLSSHELCNYSAYLTLFNGTNNDMSGLDSTIPTQNIVFHRTFQGLEYIVYEKNDCLSKGVIIIQ